MQTSSSVALVISAAAVLSLAPLFAMQRPAAVAVHGLYSEWLSPHVGKEFFVSTDLSVATERARTTEVPAGAIACKLVDVGQDYVWFENKTDRVSVPLAALRVALRR